MVGRSTVTEDFTLRQLFDDSVVVLSSFVHPDRGPVKCPAAPLLRAWLHRHGIVAGIGAPLEPVIPLIEATSSGPVMIASTFINEEGDAVGLAATATPMLVPHVRDAITVWTRTFRTRRVLLPAPAPLCPGSTRPLTAAAPSARSKQGHHPDSCPHWDHAQASVRQFTNRGDTVLLIGRSPLSDHGQRVSTSPLLSVRSLTDAENIDVPDPTAVSFVLRPCGLVEEASAILSVLRSRFPTLRGQHPDQWCYRAQDARASVMSVASRGDVTLLLPGFPEPWLSTAHRTIRLSTLADLRPVHVQDFSTIAIVGPHDSDQRDFHTTKLTHILRGLGPVSAVEHLTTTTPLPVLGSLSIASQNSGVHA